MAKKKRKSPKELLNRPKNKSCLNWYEKLDARDKAYVDLVVQHWKSQPEVTSRSIAIGLKEELGLTTHVTNIGQKLREFYNG